MIDHLQHYWQTSLLTEIMAFDIVRFTLYISLFNLVRAFRYSEAMTWFMDAQPTDGKRMGREGGDGYRIVVVQLYLFSRRHCRQALTTLQGILHILIVLCALWGCVNWTTNNEVRRFEKHINGTLFSWCTETFFCCQLGSIIQQQVPLDLQENNSFLLSTVLNFLLHCHYKTTSNMETFRKQYWNDTISLRYRAKTFGSLL